MLYWIKPSPQRQTHHLHPCWSANVLSSPPSSPPSDLCSQNSINSGSIRASPHPSQLRVKVRWAPKVGRWRLRSQGQTEEPSNFRRPDRMWDLCDKLPEDVSIPGCHGPRQGDVLPATWHRQLHIGGMNISLAARRECPSRLVPANYAPCHTQALHTWLTQRRRHRSWISIRMRENAMLELQNDMNCIKLSL